MTARKVFYRSLSISTISWLLLIPLTRCDASSKWLDTWLPWNDNVRHSRQLEDKVAIPEEAQGVFCTAITGWYDSCEVPSGNQTYCAGTKPTVLQDPVFIDLLHCYSNPYFEGRSVSFFGESPDETKILEFHIIFKTEDSEHSLKPINCQSNGVCDCSQDLITLKYNFLEKGGCQDGEDYSCLSEDFWGVNEECFVPASFQFSEDGIWCSMAAQVQRFGPCDTELDIPLQAYDTHCTAITGWYGSCNRKDDGSTDELCDSSTFMPLEKPLFIDLEACYTNPEMDDFTISFFGRANYGRVKQYHLIFNESAPDKFRPLKCASDGSCICSDALFELKEELVTNATACNDNPNGLYTCLAEDFNHGLTDRCYIPTTQETIYGFRCAMAARIEHFLPCNLSELGFGVVQTSEVDTAGIFPDNVTDTDGVEATENEIGNTKFNIPLLIKGWWTDCTQSTETEANLCRGGNLVEPEGGSIVVDFKSCYSNPNFDPRAVSFFSKSPKGGITGFHIMFVSDASYSKLAPSDCKSGVCDCALPSELGNLKEKLVADGDCGADTFEGVICSAKTVEQKDNNCYVPFMEEIISSKGSRLYCSMVAELDFKFPDLSQDSGVEIQGEAEEPRIEQVPSKGSTTQHDNTRKISTTGAIIGSLMIATVILCTVLAVQRTKKMRNDRAKEFGFGDDGEEEIVWIPTNAYNPKFTTRSLTNNLGPEAKGRSGVMRDKYPPTWSSTNPRPPERPIVGKIRAPSASSMSSSSSKSGSSARPTASSAAVFSTNRVDNSTGKPRSRHDEHITDLRFTIT
jgi:hypothetical protein